MELKRSYLGFYLWMAGYTLLLFGVALIPSEDNVLPTRAVILITALALAALSVIIWLTEQIYWYSGTSYEEAAEAGSERRKAYAWKHLKIFCAFALGIAGFTLLMHLIGAPTWLDLTVGTSALCAATFCTMPIRL